MEYVCPDCGYESTGPGNCPSCETPLLKREDDDTLGVGEIEGKIGNEEDGEDGDDW